MLKICVSNKHVKKCVFFSIFNKTDHHYFVLVENEENLLESGIGERMRQQVLKALANPARIFYVPYNLAILNFVVQFLVYVVIFVVGVSTTGEMPIDPLYFMLSVFLVHFILMVYSKREPQMMQMLLAKINMLRKRVPKALRV